MQVIPVIDILGDQVVHARRGERHNYRPIVTPLSDTAHPSDVAAGLMGFHTFEALYIADLDAISGQGGNLESIGAIAARFPRLAVWVDSGVRERAGVEALLSHPQVHAVLGTETQNSTALAQQFRDHPRVILSLDFFDGRYAGPPRLLAEPALWPSRVIAMTLARVGSGSGPDVERLASLVSRAGGRQVFAAGGVRDASDLATLSAMKVAGALVATALHSGSLSARELTQFGRVRSAN